MKIKPTSMTSHILATIINHKPRAFAYIQGKEINGTICFYEYNHHTVMIYEIHGLPPTGFFGFHIHEGNTCINDTAIPYEKTYGHYNPTHQEHPHHLGDLPPLFALHSTAWSIVYIDKFTPQDIIGRTIVIHEKPDDFHTQPSGNSMAKIACGVIQPFHHEI